MLLEPKPTIVYGPVNSRRLGRSLGVNLLPGRRKICTFDCVYCQYGWTRSFDVAEAAEDLPSCEEVLAAVEEAVSGLDVPPEWLTLSGNGEPTLHPQLGEVVRGLNRLRDRLCPTARTTVLSNSSQVGRAEVREALSRLDARIMKLDAGDERTFEVFNRPAPGVVYASVIEGLLALEDVTVQTLFADGRAGNFADHQVSTWMERVVELAPSVVQIYSLDRGTPSREILPVPMDRLEEVGERLREAGLEARVYGR